MKTTPISVKLNMPLTAEAKADLKDFLRKIEEGFEADKLTDAERQKLLDRIAQLHNEAGELEKQYDAGNYEALEKLTSKKSQLAILTSKSREPEKGRGNGRWHALMIDVNDYLRPYFVIAMGDLSARPALYRRSIRSRCSGLAIAMASV